MCAKCRFNSNERSLFRNIINGKIIKKLKTCKSFNFELLNDFDNEKMLKCCRSTLFKLFS